MSWKDDFSSAINTYQFTTKLASTGQEITFKPVDTATLKKLVVYENSDDYKMIELLFDELLRSTIIEPNDIDIDSMMLYDRQSLLMDIRTKSKGDGIQHTFNCPKCEGQSVQTIKIADFPFKLYQEPQSTLISIAGPVGINVGHVTRKEQKEMFDFLEQDTELKRNDKSLVSPFYTFAAAIKGYVNQKEIKTDLTPEDKLFISDKLPDSVLEKVKAWLEENAFGYEVVFKYKCPHCQYEESKKIEFGESI